MVLVPMRLLDMLIQIQKYHFCHILALNTLLSVTAALRPMMLQEHDEYLAVSTSLLSYGLP